MSVCAPASTRCSSRCNTGAPVASGRSAWKGFFKVGGDTSYVGPDFIGSWYDRNLRIFRNLQRITNRPDERLLVV